MNAHELIDTAHALVAGDKGPYGRAIQEPALDIWYGEPTNVSAAQRALYHRAWCDRAARRGEYTASMERT